jgi:hypothetical protein
MELGAAEARASNAKFVNLRIGKIAQTSKEPQVGFSPAKTVNKSGTENHFFAKPYDNITGYVDEIRWHTHELPDGTVLAGWNININTGREVFVLAVSSNDRPFTRLMSVLCNVDFRDPVRFVGFMGEYKGKKQKVLLVKQENVEGEEYNVQPKYETKFLSQLTIKKLKEKIALTEDEKKNIAYLPDGKIDGDYPYIKEGATGKWNFEQWTDFLMDKMNEDVIPTIEAAKEERGDITPSDYSGSPEAIVEDEDDSSEIPF